MILTWTNADVYNSIGIYEDASLVDSIDGSLETYTVTGVTKGLHCYNVCGFIGPAEA